MIGNSRPSLQIDMNEFKIHLHIKGGTHLTLHFDSPSRRFYLSVIALVVNEMKKLTKIRPIRLQEHLDLLVLLNETIGGAAGSSHKGNLLHRIYRKWKDALPNLEEAPLFKVLGRKKEEGDGASGKVYSLTDAEKDGWANLFGYVGSEENVRLKFALDKIGVGLNEISIIFGDFRNGEAWDQFIASLEKQEEEKEETAPVEGASVNRMKYPTPDGPSIAVLPFANMSEDPKDEFLCDGMAEAIIMALARVPRMFVISRNSAFTYKGKPVKVKQVSEELGVQYLLEGSLQRSGDHVRVTVQLIDAFTGNHLWAERYDRDLKDLFTLQDEITMRFVAGVQVKLLWGGNASRYVESIEKHYRGKQDLDYYLKLMEAHGYRLHWTIEDANLARRMVEEAVAMCPENPIGYMSLGWVHFTDYLLGNTKSPGETLKKGIDLAQKVLAIDDSLACAHSLLSHLFCLKGEYDKAIAEGERAVALDPGWISAICSYANSLSIAGRGEEAIPLFQKAIRLSPFGPSFLYNRFGWALQNTGRFEGAVSAHKKAIQIAPDDLLSHIGLTAAYIMTDREKEARAEAAEVLRINPKFSVDSWAKTFIYKDQSQQTKFVNALRKAGLK